MMVRIVTSRGQEIFDSYEDLRGSPHHKNLEKIYGPEAVLTLSDGYVWNVRRCPLCNCIKSFNEDVPNKPLFGCDRDCPCHDGLTDES